MEAYRTRVRRTEFKYIPNTKLQKYVLNEWMHKCSWYWWGAISTLSSKSSSVIIYCCWPWIINTVLGFSYLQSGINITYFTGLLWEVNEIIYIEQLSTKSTFPLGPSVPALSVTGRCRLQVPLHTVTHVLFIFWRGPALSQEVCTE